MSDAQNIVVPKFGSFKPKVAAVSHKAADTKPEQESEIERHHKSHLDKEYKNELNKHRSSHHERDRDKESKHHRKKLKAKSPEPTSVFDNEGADLFRIDRKGDLDNLKYGRMHKYSIPPYRRIGYGRVLGAVSKLKIDRDHSTDHQIVLQELGKSGRETSRSLLLKSAAKDTRNFRFIRPTEAEQSLDHRQDFLSLRSSRKRKRGSQSPFSEHGKVDYRSIEGKAKEGDQPVDEDLEYFTDTSTSGRDEEADIQARVKNGELTRRTREEPENLCAWTDLIDHQLMLFESAATGRTLSSIEQRNLGEIRLDIYEKALQKIGKDAGARTTLWLGMLRQGAMVWETKKLSSKWQEALRAHPNSLQLWTNYLNFIQTSFSDFRYERCKTEYVKCLLLLADTQKGGKQDQEGISKIFIYLLLRITTFMRDSGYSEHSEALWQAFLEMRFFLPDQLQKNDTSKQELLSSFEEFWESEVPRLGEPDANGWSHFSPGREDLVDPIITVLEHSGPGRHIFKRFASAEYEMTVKLAHPGRSADEAGEDDPFHIIFFNDLEPFLVPEILCLVPRLHLLHGFLCYLGLPPLPSALDRTYDDWWLDPFLRHEIVATESKSPRMEYRQITTDVLFSNAFEGLTLQDPTWIRQALRMLVERLPDLELLAEYMLAFEYHFFSDTSAKTAKALLKARRSSLRLYNCYGIIESRSKRTSSANKVFATAVAMSASLNDVQRKDTVLLWRTWVWEALRTKDEAEAIRRLLSIGEASPSAEAEATTTDTYTKFPSSTMLKATRWLLECRDSMMSIGDHHLAVLGGELLALLAYFRHSHAIKDGLAMCTELSTTFGVRQLSNSPANEHLHQACSQLIAYHVETATGFKPSIIRNHLSNSISLFPNNTILLTAYVNNEKRFRIDDRVRSLMSSTLLRNENSAIITWCFAVWSEMQRGLELGGTIHAVRAVFEQAVDSANGRHSIALWKSYFRLEVQSHDLRRARQVFFRGLRNLPWSKWWVVLVFEYLDGEMKWDEMRSLWNVFSERELRVLVDIGDVLEDMDAEKE